MQLTFTVARFLICCQLHTELTGKQRETVSILMGMAAIQRDLSSLEGWTSGNLLEFHKDTRKDVYLQQKNPLQLYRMDTD